LGHPVQDLLLAPVIVLVVEVPEFSFEMTERPEFLEGDKFPVEYLVIPFDLTATAWIVGAAED
jgi:hypothetical protein